MPSFAAGHDRPVPFPRVDSPSAVKCHGKIGGRPYGPGARTARPGGPKALIRCSVLSERALSARGVRAGPVRREILSCLAKRGLVSGNGG